jgi:hypothetical protein
MCHLDRVNLQFLDWFRLVLLSQRPGGSGRQETEMWSG